MKTLIAICIAFSSFASVASVEADLERIKSRLPEVGVVQYNEIVSLNIGESRKSEEDFRTQAGHVVKREVVCETKANTAEAQQNSNFFGRVTLTPNSVVSLAGTLYSCN